MADIQINELLESTTAANSDWIAIDNGTATKKISVENFNATGAASAAQSAAAAAQSASAALAAQTAAEQAEDDAQALITSAQTIVSDAQTYANEAATSAGTASTAANTATAQAAIATQAATQAGTYAQNVDSFAKTAKSWAVGGTGTRSGEDTDNSKYYSQQAHDSEINASASKTAAATSESNAAISERNAAASASSALASEQSATTSANNAATSETNAAASASSAATSASNAATSETNAANSETNADLSSEDSEAWSVGQRNGVDVPPSDPTYHNNAKYWADVASGGVSGVSSFNGRSGIVVPAIGDYAANIVEFDNTSSSLQSTTTQDAIEEIQDNVDDVASNLSTLDASLKPVAKSGAYSDLTGTPTLATVATSGSYNDLSNTPTLGTAAAKNSTDAVTPGSTALVESGAVYDIADGLNNAILGNATAIAKAYKYDDTTDTAIADADYIPFYDVSASTMKKIAVSNLNLGNEIVSNSNDKYSSSKAYSVGELCIYNNILYRCITACSAAAWSVNQSCFVADTLTNALNSVNTQLTWVDITNECGYNGGLTYINKKVFYNNGELIIALSIAPTNMANGAVILSLPNGYAFQSGVYVNGVCDVGTGLPVASNAYTVSSVNTAMLALYKTAPTSDYVTFTIAVKVSKS